MRSVRARAWRAAALVWRTCGVPSRHDDAAVGRVGLDGVDGACQLVHALPGVVSVEVDVLGTASAKCAHTHTRSESPAAGAAHPPPPGPTRPHPKWRH